MTILTAESAPSRKILAVVTVGRLTHAMPILEICKVLHSRGHVIEFACLNGCQAIATPYPFISKVRVVAKAVDPEEDERIARAVDESDISTPEGRRVLVDCLMFFDSFWEETFKNLDKLCASPERPHFILADLLDHACIDMMNKWHIPLAVHYPQMPWMFVPQSYIPGLPGFQKKLLTSEQASLWERIQEDIFTFSLLFSLRRYGRRRAKMRKAAGAPPTTLMRKPNYLVFVNSFFGLEVPKDLPPLITTVGPILSDDYALLDDDTINLLKSHTRVVYIAFGSHVKLVAWRLKRIVQGVTAAMDSGDLDGVIWALKLPKGSIQELGHNEGGESRSIEYRAIFENRHLDWKITQWAPQRAILAHPSTRLFISHCGSASINESIFHGVPILGMPIYGDQIAHSRRAVAAGVALTLDKHNFTVNEVQEKILAIAGDTDGIFARNVLRMRRIATVNTRRKHVAADMIEEVVCDHELRFENSTYDAEWKDAADQKSFRGVGHDLRPMHLQTADSRMSWIKGNNWDVRLVYLSVLALPYAVVKLVLKLF